MARSVAIDFLISGATSANGRIFSGSILTTWMSVTPKRPCTGALVSPSLSAKAASATAWSMMPLLVSVPRSMSLSVRPRSLAMSAKLVPLAMRSASALAASDAGEHDLLELALLGRAEAVAVLLVGALDVVVGDLDPARLLARDQRQHLDLAIFRRAEEDLALRRNTWRAPPGSGRGCRRPGHGRAAHSRPSAARSDSGRSPRWRPSAPAARP